MSFFQRPDIHTGPVGRLAQASKNPASKAMAAQSRALNNTNFVQQLASRSFCMQFVLYVWVKKPA